MASHADVPSIVACLPLTISTAIVRPLSPSPCATSTPAVHLTHEGQLRLRILPFRTGEVVFSCVLKDDGGTDFGGVDRSQPASFKIVVTNVNDAPFFELSGPAMVYMQEEGELTIPGFAVAIRAGEWREEWQTMRFQLTHVSGPVNLFDALQVDCFRGLQRDASCASGNATLFVRTLPNHFGNVTYNLTLWDNSTLVAYQVRLQITMSLSAFADHGDPLAAVKTAVAAAAGQDVVTQDVSVWQVDSSSSSGVR